MSFQTQRATKPLPLPAFCFCLLALADCLQKVHSGKSKVLNDVLFVSVAVLVRYVSNVKILSVDIKIEPCYKIR